MSTPPNSSAVRSTSAGTDASSAMSTATAIARPPASVMPFGDDGGACVVDVGADDGRAGVGKDGRVGLADAPGGCAGDDRDLALE